MGQDINLESEMKKPWNEPWFNIFCTHNQLCVPQYKVKNRVLGIYNFGSRSAQILFTFILDGDWTNWNNLHDKVTNGFPLFRELKQDNEKTPVCSQAFICFQSC